ncbi:MAG: outer membrane beta-barrel protein [Siphonobacter sp.]
MQKGIFILSLFLALVGTESVRAQYRFSKSTRRTNKSLFEPYSSVSFGVGTANYYGELSPYHDPINSTFYLMRWNVGGSYTRHFTPRLSGRASLALARLSGDDYTFSKNKPEYYYNYIRNLHFRNDIKELSFTGLYNLIPEGRNFKNRPQIMPYVFAGIAVVAHNPKARTPVDMGNDWVSLQPLGTEGQGRPGYAKPYSRITAAIPFGLGIKYKVNQRWDVSIEAGIRFTFTDYIDDVGGSMADPNDLIDNPTALAMSNRSLEATAARKGGDRTATVRQYLIDNFGYPNDPNLNPFSTAIPGYSAKGDARGGGSNDVYVLTAFHVHYTLLPKIKCPPTR